MQVGTRLRDARLSRNLTLHDISRATKISVRLLESIDRDDLAAIPGEFFARAFLRAYATEVGLDPAEIVGDYVKQLPPAAVRPVDEPPEATAPPDVHVRRLVHALAVCVTIAGGAWGFVYLHQRQSRNSAPSASSPAAQSLGVGSTETSDAAPVSTPDKPEESVGPPVTAWPSKLSESERSASLTSASDAHNSRPTQLKPAPSEGVPTRKPPASDSSEPPAAETPNQPIEQRPVEATAAVPADEPNPNQRRIQ